jgi:hypothetical protein
LQDMRVISDSTDIDATQTISDAIAIATACRRHMTILAALLEQS